MRRLLLLLLLLSPLVLASGVLTSLLGSGDGITLDAGNGGTVFASDSSSPYDTTAGIRFNTNGTVETGVGTDGGLSWSDAGNWIEPTGSADSSYDVRYVNLVQQQGSGDWTTSAAVQNIWINLGTQRVWLSNSTITINREFDIDFEVQKNAGAPPSTASSAYTIHVENSL